MAYKNRELTTAEKSCFPQKAYIPWPCKVLNTAQKLEMEGVQLLWRKKTPQASKPLQEANLKQF